MSSYNLKAQLIWIEALFNERFAQKFKLSCVNDKFNLKISGSEKKILFHRDDRFFNGGPELIHFSEWEASKEGFKSVLGSKIPAPGLEYSVDKIIIKCPDGFLIKYDVIGLIYWVLSRKEEVDADEDSLDGRKRFKGVKSHAYKHGYLERPIIDEWFLILAQIILKIWPDIKLKKNSFVVKVSHDVDMPSSFGMGSYSDTIKRMMGHLIKRRDFVNAFKGPYIHYKTKTKLPEADPLNTFSWLMDCSEQNNLKSAFYFLGGKTNNKMDGDYSLKHPAIRKLLLEIHSRGHEIGLHPSYDTFLDAEKLISEAENLRDTCEQLGISQEVWGGRMHFLRWRHPETLYAWEKAKFDYESTLGYADYAGFRCGTCFEYPAFDPINNKCLNIRIRPLIAMECSVTEKPYMDLGFGETALKKFLQLKNTCNDMGGNFTLLWHNNKLQSKEQRNLYKKILS